MARWLSTAWVSQVFVDTPASSAARSTFSLTETGSRRLIRAVGSSASLSGSDWSSSASPCGAAGAVRMVASARSRGWSTTNVGSPSVTRT